jgi:hypothetical protein
MAAAGTLGRDWKSARAFYEGLNKSTGADLDDSTIDQMTGEFLEQRYLAENNLPLPPGQLPLNPYVNNPTKPLARLAFENQLRSLLYAGQQQINQQLLDWVSSSPSCLGTPDSSTGSPSDTNSSSTSGSSSVGSGTGAPVADPSTSA